MSLGIILIVMISLFVATVFFTKISTMRTIVRAPSNGLVIVWAVAFIWPGCAGPPLLEPPPTGTSEGALNASNGLHMNGLHMNGLHMNGLHMNGLHMNGLHMNGIGSSGLHQN